MDGRSTSELTAETEMALGSDTGVKESINIPYSVFFGFPTFVIYTRNESYRGEVLSFCTLISVYIKDSGKIQ